MEIPTERRPWLTWFALASITLLGAVLRLYHLGYKALWLDEAVIYSISQGNLKEIILENAKRNSAPPTYALLVNFIAWFGQSEAALRSLSVVAGIASIPAMYWLARQFLGKLPSLFAALVVAVSLQQVVYAQQLREYTLAFLLASFALGFFARFLRNPNVWNWFFLSMACAGGILLQYGVGLLALGLNLVFALELIINPQIRSKGMIVKFILAQVIALSAAMGVVFLSLRWQMRIGFGSTPGSYYLDAAYGDRSLLSLFNLATHNSLDFLHFAFLPGLFVFMVYLGLVILFVKKEHLILAMTLVPMAITILTAWLRFYPYHGGRQDFFLVPMIYLVSAFGMDYLLKFDHRRITPVLITIILVWTGLVAVIAYLKFPGIEDLRPVAQAISDQGQPGDRIYIYYGAHDGANYYFRDLSLPRIEGIYSRDDPQGYLPQIDDILTGPGRVWLVFSHCHEGECDLIRDYIAQRRAVERLVSGNDAYLYLAR